jgi:hypothetical protein
MPNVREFSFKIDGQDVRPDTVPLRDLFDILVNLEAAIAVSARHLGAKAGPELTLRLTHIAEGSDVCTLAAPEEMFSGAEAVLDAIARDEFSALPVGAHGHLHKIWKKTKVTGWTLNLAHSGMTQPATILPSREILRPGAVSGRTTMYGKLDRVGGENWPSAVLIHPVMGKITVRLANSDLAKELGDKLFKMIGLEGEARWDSDEWELEEFRADAIVAVYPRVGITEAFEALAQAAGDTWDTVDPEEYVRELRSDD